MGSFAKSVMTGFAFSLGAALFRKLSPKLGLDDKASGKADAERAQASESSKTGAADDADGEQPVSPTN